LTMFLDESLKSRRRIHIGTNTFIDAPCFLVQNETLWGATAMIFAELESLLKGA